MIKYKFSDRDIEMMSCRMSETVNSEPHTRLYLRQFFSPDEVEYRLRYWDDAKHQYLLQLMGGELDLARDIRFERSMDETQEEINELVTEWREFRYEFDRKLQEALNIDTAAMYCVAYYNMTPEQLFYEKCKSLFSNYALFEGITDFRTAAVKVNGTTIQIEEGSKTMRIMGKIAKALDMTAQFEQFRIAHSQVLNQKKISGRLHLSIHPLDYMTASDNACGWSSCMSWDEAGCYRMGTVEMMNSSMVICAYLDSRHSTYKIGGQEWNSKKWRAWVIVTKDIIVVNRNFPYENEELNKLCLEWVRDLAAQNLGWHYHADMRTISSMDADYHFDTNYMYNDMCSGYYGYEGMDTFDSSVYINFSGPAMCIGCGSHVGGDSDCDEPGTLLCVSCRDVIVCAGCGSVLNEDNTYWGPDDEPYCECCHSDRFVHAECCDLDVDVDDCKEISLPINHEWLIDKILDDEQYACLRDVFLTDSTWWYSANQIHRDWVFRKDGLAPMMCMDCCEDAGIHTRTLEHEEYLRLKMKGWTNISSDVLDEITNWKPFLRAAGLSYATYYNQQPSEIGVVIEKLFTELLAEFKNS